jgi:CRISPR-associated protein Csx17
MNTANELILAGCTPTPLASYLKALGILRLLGEQKPDWAVRGAWRNNRFVLSSPVFSSNTETDRKRLQDFLLHEYRPTPIISPWSGRVGFLEGEKGTDSTRAGPVLLRRLEEATSERFRAYRDVVRITRSLESLRALDSARAQIKKQSGEKIDVPAMKTRFLYDLRAQLPDEFLPWLDACLVLGEDKLFPAPTLGTGGNEGSMDFSVNHLTWLCELFDLDSGAPSDIAIRTLPEALFAAIALLSSGVNLGQLAPASGGGPNMGIGFGSLVLDNPWNFIFMLEGVTILAASTTKLLESDVSPALSFPFAVYPTQAGHGGIAEGENARPEVWLPLWSHWMGLHEVRFLFREGRATLGRRRVERAIDFAQAVAGLAIDRGIDSFQRYGFYERRGQGYFVATALGRFSVPRSRSAAADLIEELEAHYFLDRLRRFARDDKAPARIRSRIRQLEDSLFELTQRAHPRTLQNVLTHLGALAGLLSKSRKALDKEKGVPPVPILSEFWAIRADDGSPEFRLAAALAGLYGDGLPIRPFVVPLKQEKYGDWVWDADSRLAVWGQGSLIANLSRIIARRRLEAVRQDAAAKPYYRFGTSRGDVAALLSGDAGGLDEPRLAALFQGLVHARIPENLASRGESASLPAAYAVLKPFFTPDALLARFLPPERGLPLPSELIARLRAARVQKAVDWAWQRLKVVGFPLPPYPKTPPAARNLDGQRLLAALAVPLERGELLRCLNLIARQDLVEPA